MKCPYILLLWCVFSGSTYLHAQPSVHKLKANTDAIRQSQVAAAFATIISPTQAGVAFQQEQLGISETRQWLFSRLEMRPEIDVLLEEGIRTKAASELEVIKFRQYYKGIKVEHGVVNTTHRNGTVVFLQLEFYSIPTQLHNVPALTEGAALEKATAFMRTSNSAKIDGVLNNNAQTSAGELVIVRTYTDDSIVCLAWKFEIVNLHTLTGTKIYIDAQKGDVVLRDAIIKDGNVTGTAATRYSGTQTIVTDNGGGDPAKRYRLQQLRNGHLIKTLNVQGRSLGDLSNVIDFVDNDNNWEASEHSNAAQDDAALDVHFNMQVVSDYLATVHNRNSWDNGNAPINSYVHAADPGTGGTYKPVNNAKWFRGNMIYGDGTFSTTTTPGPEDHRPFTSLDICAHELGHGITDATCNLIYRWESGALNEGFSDIWGALIEKWGIEQYPTIAGIKNIWLAGEEITSIPGSGLRNMQDPRTKGDPSTYKDNFWKPASITECKPFQDFDACGVHKNSGVLNKWFYLITEGEVNTNSLNQPYNVTGMGFTKSGSLAYLTLLNLTPNAGFSTCKAVSMYAATSLFGAGSAEVETVRSAWRAVGVDSAIWDMSNTPLFAANNTQNFYAIGLANDGTVWAGTDKRGLYVFDGTTWTKRTEIPNVRINDIRPDQKGGIWVAQSGTTSSGTAAGGGVNYFANTGSPMTAFYTVSTNTDVPTRNVRGLFIDSSRLQLGTNTRVWVATNLTSIVWETVPVANQQ